ncbi:30S ribosomal protein S3 [Candidatus Poribacteria bacterium]|nr:MAG: 30S ribosomal protein S3 [Candidatus Poribacteria bacterium]
MGQKTHPRGLRLGIIETWDSKWYSDRDYAKWLHEDFQIQRYIKEQLERAGVSRIEVERVAEKCTIYIHTARPGIVIGRRGVDAERLKAELEKLIGRPVKIEVMEIKVPELDAQLLAEAVATQIERRISFKQAMRRKIADAMQAGAQGVKIMVSGRLDGKEIARSESSLEGRVPLHTLRANVDYGFTEANTTYGKIGVKTWIFKGEILGVPEALSEESSTRSRRQQSGRQSNTGSGRQSNTGSGRQSNTGDQRSGNRQRNNRTTTGRQRGRRRQQRQNDRREDN